MFTTDHIRSHLELAVKTAANALALGNYPIGCVVTDAQGKILSVEMNEFKTALDITAHAEVIALRKLGMTINRYEPGQHFLFTSLEPCYGCSFFIARSNIKGVYSALKDPHKGGMSDLKAQPQFEAFFKDIELQNDQFDDLMAESKNLMRKYFLGTTRPESAKYYL